MSWLGWLLSEGWKLVLLVVASGGGVVALTVKACKKFGEKWLDAQFAERLEALKHEQAKEIEGMRRNVQWEFSRISKIHEKEFEVLPKAWLMLHEAHGRSAGLVATLKSSPDIDSMSEATLQEFVQAISVPQSIKDELLKAEKGKRNNLYSDKIGWIELSNAEKAQYDLNNYLLEHRILMSDELASALREVSKELAIVNVIYRNYKESKLANPFAESAELFNQSVERLTQIAPHMEQIGSLIQERLNYEKA
jgi:hypothetical protein